MLTKYILKAIIFIYAAFNYKTKVFSYISINEISNISPILYFSHIFIFWLCLGKNITNDIFWKINVYFIWRSHLALNVMMFYINGKLMKRNILTYSMVTFFTITSYCVVRFSSSMYQTNCICTGFQLILNMLTRTNHNESKMPHCAWAMVVVIRRGTATVVTISKHSLRLLELWRSLQRTMIFCRSRTNCNLRLTVKRGNHLRTIIIFVGFWMWCNDISTYRV